MSTPTPTSMKGNGNKTPFTIHNSILHDQKLRALHAEADALRLQLADKDPNAIVQKHIQLLHTYNEIKDGTQALIGRYALMTNRTIKEIHQELELPLTD
ncbi:DNA repair protein Swi5/Sae3 [Cryptococcus deuterogattii 99/473]|uniref:DNA repair protein Swi5/Sae3 n=1 Tax=Cryptococcus deuterogattii Ram5 TaxID=1296110 RepID=A0A0D0UWM7_9TREE|nr:DNA repair protein Swi5/Sae3 [Cryptococcus deuterogattii Ram5]KIY59281.1 DNA repair protein Swi5/Sae3 [Cryptococcus deuterogattii 99/473]